MKISNKWITVNSRSTTRSSNSDVALQFSAGYAAVSGRTCRVDFNRESDTEPYNEWLKLEMTVEEAESFAARLLDIAARAKKLGPE